MVLPRSITNAKLSQQTVKHSSTRAGGFGVMARAAYHGRLSRFPGVIDIQVREFDPALWAGDYENDPAFRQTVQYWVNQLWIEKDQRIDPLRAELKG
jgi:hypothetical protein